VCCSFVIKCCFLLLIRDTALEQPEQMQSRRPVKRDHLVDMYGNSSVNEELHQRLPYAKRYSPAIDRNEVNTTWNDINICS
jgi:hypothetical protein